MPANGKYSDEEVRKILDRALRGDPERGVSHDELVAIASEVGVSRAFSSSVSVTYSTNPPRMSTASVLSRTGNFICGVAAFWDGG